MLADRLQVMAVATNFSKIIIDPSVNICQANLIKTKWANGQDISINENGFRLWERLSDSYLEYQKVLREVMLFLEVPRVIVSIHSHTSQERANQVQLYSPNLKLADCLANQLAESLEGTRMTSPQDEAIMPLDIKMTAVPFSLDCGTQTLDSLINFD